MQFLESVMASELDREMVNKTTTILSILSKKDALSIFLLAKDGLKAETNTPQKVGLTRKQYYTRLKQLVDSGLIDKSGDEYTHTTLGSFVHQKHVLELFEHAKHVKQMKMVDTLKRTKQFSEDDISKFVGKIAGKNITTDLTSSALVPIRFISSYENMVSSVLELIEFSKSEILLASRFQNDLIINKILLKADAGINVRIIGDTSLIRSYIKSEEHKLQTMDKYSIERLLVAGNPWYPKKVGVDRKLRDVPFSMVVVDGKGVAIELVDRFENDKFKHALFVNDKTFAEEMGRVFHSWWSSAGEDDLMKIVEEMMTLKSS